MASSKLNFPLMDRPIVVALTTSLLLFLSLPPISLYPIAFFALVPLLVAEHQWSHGSRSAWKFSGVVWMVFFLWNAGSAYWLFLTQPKGALIIFLINGLMMSLPWWIYQGLKKRVGVTTALFGLIGGYLLYEWLTHHWELGYPIFTFANTLAPGYFLIQWIEWTGWMGVSGWILACNAVIFILILKIMRGEALFKVALFSTVVLVVPILVSLLRWMTYQPAITHLKVLVLHTQVDAFTEKYKLENQTLIDRYMALTKKYADESTDLIVWPETALPNGGWVEDMHVSPDWNRLQAELQSYPQTRLLIGALLVELFSTTKLPDPEPYRHVLAQLDNDGRFYFQYNVAVMVSSQTDDLPFRSKAKMVPVEETLPYPRLLGGLQRVIGSLAGFNITHRHANTEVFDGPKHSRLSYSICFESLFGHTNRQLVKSGAQLIAVGLNESWYQNTTASRQFAMAAVIRSMENRRSVVRAANEGISSIISPTGKVLAEATEPVPLGVQASVPINFSRTIYTRFGDYFLWIALALLVFSLIGYAKSSKIS